MDFLCDITLCDAYVFTLTDFIEYKTDHCGRMVVAFTTTYAISADHQ